MSGGQFALEGECVSRRYASDRPASAHLASEQGKAGEYGQFVLEVLRQVDVDLDLTRFDNDGPDGVANSGDDDGWVDYLFLNMLSTPHGFLQGIHRPGRSGV